MTWQPGMNDVESHLLEAETALDEGDPEGARLSAEQALELWPDCAEAWYLRGLALLDLGQPDEARGTIDKALAFDPEHAAAAWSLADLLVYEYGDVEHALELCDVFLRRDLADELYADFLNLKASALCEIGEFASALPVYRRAAQLCPDREDAGGIGWCQFEICDFDRAEKALCAAVSGAGHDNPATHHYLAVTFERRGDNKRALKHFRIGARLDPEHWFVPIQVPEDEFAGLVEAAVDGLSGRIKEALHNVAVTVEAWPSREDLELTRLSPLIVGMMSGPTLRDRSTEDPWSTLPSHIVVYQRNLEYTCRSREEIVEQIRITLWHEVGHFLGLSEEELHGRGLG